MLRPHVALPLVLLAATLSTAWEASAAEASRGFFSEAATRDPARLVAEMPRVIPIDDAVATLHCYHFLEHLTGKDAVLFLREVERVLIPERGVMNFSMPYFSAPLMAQDIDHKSSWCEDTFDNLFWDTTYHHFGKWKLQVHFLIIAGVVHRNLALVGQIIKSDRPRVSKNEWWYPS